MLNVIIGRNGTAKTDFIYSKIKEDVLNNENVVFIVPEQNSFVSEYKLLELLGEENIGDVSCLSFTRLAYEMQSIYGNNDLPTLSNGAKAILMKKAINNCKDKLSIYKNSVKHLSFINSVIEICDEMVGCEATPEIVESVADEIDKKSLKSKLYDISVIMQEYNSLIENRYFDTALELSRLYEKLVKTNFFDGKTVYIDGFFTFGAFEFKIIELIIKQSKNVTVTFSCNKENDCDGNFFFLVNDALCKVKNFADKNGCGYKEIVLTQNKYFENDELYFLEQNITKKKPSVYKNKDIENINIFEASTVYDECDFVAREIHKLLRTTGISAKDIAVVTRNAEKYGSAVISSFEKYDIPYYFDERHSIFVQPLVVFLDYLFRIINYSFRLDDVISFIKSGVFDLTQSEISEFENYAVIWNINGNKWYDDFINHPDGFKDKMTDYDKKRLEKINEIRRNVILPVLKFKKECKNSSADEICKNLYQLIVDFKIKDVLKKKAILFENNNMSALAKEQEAVWNLVMQILSEIYIVLENEKSSLKEFSEYFSLMIQNCELGTLPEGVDNIQFGEINRVRLNSPKVVFSVGMNEGDFPKNVEIESIITASERKYLTKSFLNYGVEITGVNEYLSAYERVYLYTAVSSASQKVFLSYHSFTDSERKEPCEYISKIKRIFPSIKVAKQSSVNELEFIETKASAFEYMCSKWSENTVVEETLKHYFSNESEFIGRYKSVVLQNNCDEMKIENSDVATKLFGETMRLSASRIEDYYNCPFKYFCKFGIGAYPLIPAEYNAMQTGLIVHYIMENILKEFGKDDFVNSELSELMNFTDKYLKKYIKEEMGIEESLSSKLLYDISRLKWLLMTLFKQLRIEFSQSEFVPVGFEVEVNENSAVEAPVFKTEFGSIILRGSIDRVDVFEKDGTNYIRVIDYKTGSKDFELSDIISGLNLQMFIYLFAACNDEKYMKNTLPAGVLYLPSGVSVVSSERHNQKDLESTRQSKYKMKGMLIDDEDVLRAMESDLGDKFIPVKDKKGVLSGNIASLEEIGRLEKKINSLIVDMGNSLCKGEIAQKPVGKYDLSHTACDFCDYLSVCSNRKVIEPRIPFNSKIKFDDALELLKEDNENA